MCWTRFKVCLCFIVLFHGVILGLLSQVQPKKVWFWTGLWMTFPGLSWTKIAPCLLPCVLSKMVKCLVVSSYHDQNPASVIAAENLLDYISKFRVGESHVEHTSHVAVVKDSHSQYGEWPKPENRRNVSLTTVIMLRYLMHTPHNQVGTTLACLFATIQSYHESLMIYGPIQISLLENQRKCSLIPVQWCYATFTVEPVMSDDWLISNGYNYSAVTLPWNLI